MTDLLFNEVKAAGGIIFRWNPNPEVLLICRRGIWDLPKGHLEAGESLEYCAAREVSEEIGIPTPVNLGTLGTTIHQYREKGKMIRKHTWWYAMFTSSEQFVPLEVEDITEVRWFPLNEAKEKVGYENLRQLLSKFEAWLTSFENFNAK